MYEHRTEPLLPPKKFIGRMARSALWAAGLIVVSLSIGIIGYHTLGQLAWIDALVNASMILGGMGPVRELPNDTAKTFASIYALFSGVIFIALMGIILAPVAHRVLHKFHVDEKDVK